MQGHDRLLRMCIDLIRWIVESPLLRGTLRRLRAAYKARFCEL